jgi:FMN phosphatase YigB (HAD superfamily)
MKVIIWDFNGTIYNSSENALYKGAKKLLVKFSKKYKQALATTSFDIKGRMELIKSFGIWDYFDRVNITLKSKKLFLDICKEFNCKAEEVYVVGDGYLKEIRIGNKLGMKTILIDRKGKSGWKDRLFKRRSWKKIDNVSELENIL